MPLLRASDFCRPPNGSRPHEVRLEVIRPSSSEFWCEDKNEPSRPPPPPPGGHRPSSTRTTEECDERERRRRPRQQRQQVLVDVGPTLDRVLCEKGDDGDDDTASGSDESLVAFATVEVLQQFCLLAGTIVVVEKLSHPFNGEGRRRSVPARLCVLPSRAAHCPTTTTTQPDVLLVDDGSISSSSSSLPPVLYVSPMVAANLGLYSVMGGGADGGGTRWQWGTVTAHSDAARSGGAGAGGGGGGHPPKARTATLVVWGAPVPEMNRFGGRRRVSDSTSPENSRSEPSLPPAGSILSPGTVVSVAATNNTLHFLQVVRVQTDDPSDSHDGQSSSAGLAIGTVNTRYHFVDTASEMSGLGPFPPQLPPLDDAIRFLIPDGSGPGVRRAPHPDVPRLTEHFRRAERARGAAERVMALVGTDDEHHVTAALCSAAADSGRRCVDAGHSLATYAYLRGGDVTGSGSIVDKLRGLHLAWTLAAEHSPSVVILRLDNEFSGDKHERHDQESRAWSLLSQVRSPSVDAAGRGSENVVAVLIVKEPLDPEGPLSQHMVTPPFNASRPDDSYISYLWGHSSVLDLGGLDALRGRPAQEVERLFCHFKAKINERPDLGHDDDLPLLRSCCRKVDQDRRGQSHAQSRIPTVHWEDIGGLGHVRREVLDAIELPLRYPHLLPNRGECSRTGMLFWGPPGTGKTLVAKAVATECNLPFVSVRGPELMGSYIGESEENVRNVFASARRLAAQNQPPASVLFFDELDSLAPRRGGHASGGNVTDRVVATLLSELERKFDAFTVFCMGATNRPDLLDPALLRPGRLDRLIYLGVDADAHSGILRAQFRRLKLEVDVDYAASTVAPGLLPCLTGADLSTIASSALLRATRRLCAEADDELIRRQGKEESVTLDQILDSWDESRLNPVVTMEDLLISASCASASVDELELERYSCLRDEYLTTSVEDF